MNQPTSFDLFSASFLLPNIGAPFLMGLAVGYFAKKILKIALFISGASVALLFVSEYYGVSHINEQTLQQTAQTATDLATQSGTFLYNRLAQLTWKGGSAVAGFLAGLKLG